MKKIGILTLVLLTVFSCSEELEENTIQHENRLLAKDVEFLGIEHNEGLQDAFTFLEKSKQDKGNFDIKSEIKNLETFLILRANSNSKYPKQSNQIGVELTKKVFKNPRYFTQPNEKGKRITDDLSVAEKEYLDQLDQILKNAKRGDLNISKRITDLENEIENDLELDNNQLLVLFSATQTAKYSYQYWVKNAENWANLISNKANKGWLDDLYLVVASDAAGGVGGAVGALAVNLIPGLGQVAYGGAIVGGAVGASATAVVMLAATGSAGSYVNGALPSFYLNNPQYNVVANIKEPNKVTFINTVPQLSTTDISGSWNRVVLYIGSSTNDKVNLYAYKLQYGGFIQGYLDSYQHQGPGNAILKRIKVGETTPDNICRDVIECSGGTLTPIDLPLNNYPLPLGEG